MSHRCKCIRHCCYTCTKYCLSLSMDQLFTISIRMFPGRPNSYMAFVIDRPRIPHPCKVLQSLQRVLHLFAHKWMCPCCSVGCASHCTHKKPCAEQTLKRQLLVVINNMIFLLPALCVVQHNNATCLVAGGTISFVPPAMLR